MNEIDRQTKYQAIIIAMVAALLVILLCNVLPIGERLARFLVDKDEKTGDVNIWAAQNFMWLAFFWGLAELWFRARISSRMAKELSCHFLPESPEIVLTKDQLPDIHRKVVEKRGDGILAKLVCLLTSQFQITSSVSMVHDILTAEVELRQNEIDLNYNSIRYITWLIPTLGFIGTVWGILQALGTASQMDPSSPELLPAVIGSLSVAFWTTLLALIMACVLMFIQHRVQNREESLLNECAQYCLNNLINRLYAK